MTFKVKGTPNCTLVELKSASDKTDTPFTETPNCTLVELKLR